MKLLSALAALATILTFSPAHAESINPQMIAGVIAPKQRITFINGFVGTVSIKLDGNCTGEGEAVVLGMQLMGIDDDALAFSAEKGCTQVIKGVTGEEEVTDDVFLYEVSITSYADEPIHYTLEFE